MESKPIYSGPRRPSEKTFVFGFHPIAEALDSGKELDSVLVLRSSSNDRLNKLLGRIRSMGIPIKMVPREKLDAITLKHIEQFISKPIIRKVKLLKDTALFAVTIVLNCFSSII